MDPGRSSPTSTQAESVSAKRVRVRPWSVGEHDVDRFWCRFIRWISSSFGLAAHSMRAR